MPSINRAQGCDAKMDAECGPDAVKGTELYACGGTLTTRDILTICTTIHTDIKDNLKIPKHKCRSKRE